MMGLSEPVTENATPVTKGQDYYARAFYRNIGLISRREQEQLGNLCVAIPGLGGVGSSVLVTLARSGIGKFHIADFGEYDIANINRHYGAAVPTIGRYKTEVMAEIVSSINPDIEITMLTEPVTDFNVDRFLQKADIIVDGLDVFLPDTRSLLYQKARKHRLYSVLALPLGFGAALQVFSPGGMSFERYFNFKSTSTFQEKVIGFLWGVAPAALHRKYMNPSLVDIRRKRMPSSGAACQLAGSMAAAEVLNILLRRKPVKAIPHYLQFDLHLMALKRGYLRMGNKHPLQKFRIWRAKHFGSY